MIVITPFFAAIFALLYVLLSFLVIRIRFGEKISLGDGGNRDLTKAVRVHANFIEYVPLALILMWFLESITLSAAAAFWPGLALLFARILHPIGMFFPKQWMILRQIAMLITFGVLIVLSVRILAYYMPW